MMDEKEKKDTMLSEKTKIERGDKSLQEKEKPSIQNEYKEGVNICAGCSKDIHGNKICSALGKFYHKECFKCSNCNIVLKNRYNSHHGNVFCEDCYKVSRLCIYNCIVCMSLERNLSKLRSLWKNDRWRWSNDGRNGNFKRFRREGESVS